MPEIKTQTMCVAIETLAEKIRSLREILQRDGDDADLEQMIEDYERAAEDLERAYDKEAETVINLPPYDALVREPPG
jgi:hypothetical protein